jgi:hypothetical protein
MIAYPEGTFSVPSKKPPFDEQNEIGSKLMQIQNNIKIEQDYLDKMLNLKTGIMQDLLDNQVPIDCLL